MPTVQLCQVFPNIILALKEAKKQLNLLGLEQHSEAIRETFKHNLNTTFIINYYEDGRLKSTSVKMDNFEDVYAKELNKQ